MKYIKMLGLAAVAAAALMAFAGPASATILTDGAGTQLVKGTVIHANSENTVTPVTLHPPIGDITCTSSTVEGTIENPGSSTTTVSGPLNANKNAEGKFIGLTFGGCNATVNVLAPGSLEIHTPFVSTGGTSHQQEKANGNGTLTSSGASVTVVLFGFHCIFGTSNTDIGTLTGSKTGNATLDIEATIPRTGGSSGAFCGSTAQWTGNYVVDKPSTLYID